MVIFALIALLAVILLIAFVIGKQLIFQSWSSNIQHNMTSDGVSYKLFNKQSEHTLFVSHGNAGNIDMWGNPFKNLPYNVCIYDYYNYGASKMTPGGVILMSDSDLVDAGRSVLNDLLSKGYRSIVFVGISLGSHPATVLAAEYANKCPDSKLVLIVPFDHMGTLIPIAWRLFGSFDNLTPATRITQETLLVRTKHDTLMPKESCDRLKKLIPNSEILTLSGGHNDWDNPTLEDSLKKFIG